MEPYVFSGFWHCLGWAAAAVQSGLLLCPVVAQLTEQLDAMSSPWNPGDGERFLQELLMLLSLTRLWRHRLPPHFLNGAVHWIWGDFMLVYYMDKKILKLVQLPTACGSRVWRRIGSAKCLFHCCLTDSGIYIWTYNGVGGGSGGCGDKNNWEFKHNVLVQDLVDKKPKEFPDMEWNPRKQLQLFGGPTAFVQYLPVAFNKDFRILYLQCHRMVISYNARNGEIKWSGVVTTKMR